MPTRSSLLSASAKPFASRRRWARTRMSKGAMLLVTLLVLMLMACAGYVYERAGSGEATGDRAIGTAASPAEVFRPIGPPCSNGHFVSSFDHKGVVAIMRSECVHDAK